ncbi:MAG: preprotein translocase subunit SecG [Verrucomicrobia subdivision 3 bacterium]|nr:preprotein translocase subunit SecG [Limisphaerales bacterium]
MIWIIGFLTAILIIDCLFLILLVLVQLPKKEAGLGQAFGSGTTDALFGAGSGNALTKMTKYATGVFFVLTLSLSILHAQHTKNRRSGLEEAVEKANQSETATALPSTPAATPAVTSAAPAAPLTTSTNLLTAPAATTGAPAAAQSTNSPVERPK